MKGKYFQDIEDIQRNVTNALRIAFKLCDLKKESFEALYKKFKKVYYA